MGGKKGEGKSYEEKLLLRKANQLWVLANGEITKPVLEAFLREYGKDFPEQLAFQAAGKIQANMVTPLVTLFLEGFRYGITFNPQLGNTNHPQNKK